MVVCPPVQLPTTQLRPVVDHQHVGVAARLGGIVEHRHHPLAGQREVDRDRRALAGAIVLQVGGAELAPAGQTVLGEVQGPALVGGDRAPVPGHGPAAALLPAAAAEGQLLLAIQPRDELMVGPPALATEQLVQPPVAEPAALAGEGTQALAEPRVLTHALRLPLRQRA
jgi:hypothetical protein